MAGQKGVGGLARSGRGSREQSLCPHSVLFFCRRRRRFSFCFCLCLCLCCCCTPFNGTSERVRIRIQIQSSFASRRRRSRSFAARSLVLCFVLRPPPPTFQRPLSPASAAPKREYGSPMCEWGECFTLISNLKIRYRGTSTHLLALFASSSPPLNLSPLSYSSSLLWSSVGPRPALSLEWNAFFEDSKDPSSSSAQSIVLISFDKSRHNSHAHTHTRSFIEDLVTATPTPTTTTHGFWPN